MIYTILSMVVLAFTSILIVFPPLEPVIWSYLAIYPETFWWVVPIIIIAEILAALSAHVVGEKIGQKIIGRFYRKRDVAKDHARIEKWGMFGIFLFAATPLPITIAVYYMAAIRYDRKKFIIAFSIGRALKYTVYLISSMILGIDSDALIEILVFWQ